MKSYDKRGLFQQDPGLTQTLDYLTSGVFQFAHSKPKQGNMPNWYLDTRPTSKLKMIVRIPAKYFDAMSVNPKPAVLQYAPATMLLCACSLMEKIKKEGTDIKQLLKLFNLTSDPSNQGETRHNYAIKLPTNQ